MILDDPEIKRAATRTARMLWFAADTLPGAILAPGPARHRGAHRGAVSKDGVLKSACWMGVGLGLLAALLGVLAAGAFLVSRLIFSDSLAGYVAFMLSDLPILAFLLLRRRPGRGVAFSEYAWLDAAVLAAVTRPHLSALAGHRGWDHPLPFALISVCSYAVCAACISVALVIVIRSVRRHQRPDTQERPDRA